MRWLAGFVVGALVGALGMFIFLYYYPAHPAAPLAAPAVAVPAAPASPAASAAASSAPGAPAAPVQPTEPAQPAQPVGTGPAEAPGPSQPPPQPTGSQERDSMHLLVPVEGVRPDHLADSFDQPRGGAKHEAIDILAPKGTRVLAADDGKVVKLFNSKPGGLTVYQFDPSEQYAYYYAHLDRYAEGLKEGMQLKRGDLVGYVGSTGNADLAQPHLHFAVFRLTPEKQWWKGSAVNPYPLLRN